MATLRVLLYLWVIASFARSRIGGTAAHPRIFSAARRLFNVRSSHIPRSSEPTSLFIFGVGYTGLALVRSLQQNMNNTMRIHGTCRERQKAEALKSKGVVMHLVGKSGDDLVLGEDAHAAILDASHILVCIPPLNSADRGPGLFVDPVLASCGEILKRNSRLRWIGYLSTTGVYGDHGGEWVDEKSETKALPGSKPHRRLLAEEEWMTSFPSETHVFRLAGIYGPGRSALDTVARISEPTTTTPTRSSDVPSTTTTTNAAPSPDKWVSRVHVCDIANVLATSMKKPTPGVTFNVADDCPSQRQRVLDYAESLISHHKGEDSIVSLFNRMKRRRHRRSQDAATTPRRERSRGNKRVGNQLMKDMLRVPLVFPDYRTGLSAIAQGDCAPFENEEDFEIVL